MRNALYLCVFSLLRILGIGAVK